MSLTEAMRSAQLGWDGDADAHRFLSHNGTVYCLTLGTPSPRLDSQNIENKQFNLRLCARSLSLQELHAKSREHGSYGGCWRPVLGTEKNILEQGLEARAVAWGRIVKEHGLSCR